MKKNSSSLKGVLTLDPQIHSDSRGHFMELFKTEQLLDFKVRQINQAVSKKKCITQGFCEEMHFERSGYHGVVKSMDIQKIVLQPFRTIKIDTFSYSSHSNWIRTL